MGGDVSPTAVDGRRLAVPPPAKVAEEMLIVENDFAERRFAHSARRQKDADFGQQFGHDLSHRIETPERVGVPEF